MPDEPTLVQQLIDQMNVQHTETLDRISDVKVDVSAVKDDVKAVRTAFDIHKDKVYQENIQTNHNIEIMKGEYTVLTAQVLSLQQEKEAREKAQAKIDEQRKANKLARFTLYVGGVLTFIITVLSAWVIKLSEHPLFASTPKHH